MKGSLNIPKTAGAQPSLQFVGKAEKDFYPWFNTYVVKSIPYIKLYHKIQDAGSKMSSKKPFDSFLLYRKNLSMFVGIEFKLIEPRARYSIEDLKLADHQKENLRIAEECHGIGFIIVNEYSLWKDKHGVETGTDNVLFFRITDFDNNKYVEPIRCQRRSTQVTITFLNLLEEFERSVLKQVKTILLK